jgi:hypothetical protein
MDKINTSSAAASGDTLKEAFKAL